MKLLLLTMLLTAYNAALAIDADGNDKGNGGDALVCFQGTPGGMIAASKAKTEIKMGVNPFDNRNVKYISGVVSLDLYSNRKMGILAEPVEYVILDESKSLEKSVQQIFSRIQAKAPGLYEKLNSIRESMPLRKWQPIEILEEIDDSELVQKLPVNCFLIQVAVQKDLVIHFNYFVFGLMKRLDQVALILHEYLWPLALEAGQETSFHMQDAVNFILSTEFDQSSEKEITERLSNIVK